jgi:hypothetical protein
MNYVRQNIGKAVVTSLMISTGGCSDSVPASESHMIKGADTGFETAIPARRNCKEMKVFV